MLPTLSIKVDHLSFFFEDRLHVFTLITVTSGVDHLAPADVIAPLGPQLKRWTPALRRMVEDAMCRPDSTLAQRGVAQIIRRAAEQDGFISRSAVLGILGRPRDDSLTGLSRPITLIMEKLRAAGLISRTMPELLSSSLTSRTAFYSLPPGSY